MQSPRGTTSPASTSSRQTPDQAPSLACRHSFGALCPNFPVLRHRWHPAFCPYLSRSHVLFFRRLYFPFVILLSIVSFPFKTLHVSKKSKRRQNTFAASLLHLQQRTRRSAFVRALCLHPDLLTRLSHLLTAGVPAITALVPVVRGAQPQLPCAAPRRLRARAAPLRRAPPRDPSHLFRPRPATPPARDHFCLLPQRSAAVPGGGRQHIPHSAHGPECEDPPRERAVSRGPPLGCVRDAGAE